MSLEEDRVNKIVRISVGLLFLGLGVRSIYSKEYYLITDTIFDNPYPIEGIPAIFFGGFVCFCALCAIFNWKKFGDGGDL